MYCENVADISNKFSNMPVDEIKAMRISSIDNAIKEKTDDIYNLERTLEVVEKRCKDKLENDDSCYEICADILLEIKKLQDETELLRADKADVEKEIQDSLLWVKMLSENGKITELNRTVISRLIDKIYVYEDKRIEVRFSFEDKFRSLVNLSENNIKIPENNVSVHTRQGVDVHYAPCAG